MSDRTRNRRENMKKFTVVSNNTTPEQNALAMMATCSLWLDDAARGYESDVEAGDPTKHATELGTSLTTVGVKLIELGFAIKNARKPGDTKGKTDTGLAGGSEASPEA